jgi:hypothetical protein
MLINHNKMQNTSPHRAYLASVLRTFAQIQPDGWTLDTLGTLDEIGRKGRDIVSRIVMSCALEQ